MEVGTMKYLELELKYCERCGTLRLRPTGSSRIYCASCEREMEKVRKAAHRNQAPGAQASEKRPCRSVEHSWMFGSTGNRDDRKIPSAAAVVDSVRRCL